MNIELAHIFWCTLPGTIINRGHCPQFSQLSVCKHTSLTQTEHETSTLILTLTESSLVSRSRHSSVCHRSQIESRLLHLHKVISRLHKNSDSAPTMLVQSITYMHSPMGSHPFLVSGYSRHNWNEYLKQNFRISSNPN